MLITHPNLDLLQELQRLVQQEKLDWSRPVSEALEQAGFDSIPLSDVAAWGSLAWFGLLENWIHTSAISDIYVNGPCRPIITIERGTRLPTSIYPHESWIAFTQRQLLLHSGAVDQTTTDQWPGHAISGTVGQNLRFSATRPPISPHGPTLVLRVLPRHWRTLDDMVKEETLARDVADLLLEALRSGTTVLIAGTGASGKTTLVAALLQAIGAEKRVIVIEDMQELPELPDSLALESVRSGMDLAECVLFALRQRPDLLVISEIHGAEAMSLLQAASTGLPGISTIRAPDIQSTLKNLERMAAGERPGGLARGLIASTTVSILVAHIGRYGGRRQVGRVEEVLAQGTSGLNGDRYPTHALFGFDEQSGRVMRVGWVQGAWGRGQV